MPPFASIATDFKFAARSRSIGECLRAVRRIVSCVLLCVACLGGMSAACFAEEVKTADKPAVSADKVSDAASTENEATSEPTPGSVVEPEVDRPVMRVTPLSVPAKILRYASQFLKRHDLDRDGKLSEREWSRLPGNPLLADADGDRVLSEVEVSTYITRYGQVRRIRLLSSSVTGETPAEAAPEPVPAAGDKLAEPARRRDTKFFIPSGRLPAGLPTWFSERDQDGDGQLTMAEFSANPTPRDLAEFTALDRNGDGLVTAREAVRGPEEAEKPKDGVGSTKPGASEK